MKRYLILLIFLLIFSCAAFVQSSFAQSQKSGIIFKVPDNVFPIDWNKNGFKGMLMLRKESPAGIFIGYPNDEEKIEDLKARAVKSIAPMIVDDKKGITFETRSIPTHKGDSAATYYSYANEKDLLQILLYERVANGNTLIYGYFAKKEKDAKPASVKDIWADDKGQGIKIFEKFWKSLKD
ncbi:MAG TPA: hypothetical protein VNB22_11230 [Pyrinomonadaceae bacterium]|nr:hypothetical protein [Pyrinomonadaceae bacterium]